MQNENWDQMNPNNRRKWNPSTSLEKASKCGPIHGGVL